MIKKQESENANTLKSNARRLTGNSALTLTEADQVFNQSLKETNKYSMPLNTLNFPRQKSSIYNDEKYDKYFSPERKMEVTSPPRNQDRSLMGLLNEIAEKDRTITE